MTIQKILSVACVIALMNGIADAKNIDTRPVSDAFSQCMKRTEKIRLSCTGGCGMILHECYEEGVIEAATEADRLVRSISKRAAACSILAQRYQKESFQLFNSFIQEAESQSTWLADDLSLHFAKQRLATLELISKECR
jgi:hypothetical protein